MLLILPQLTFSPLFSTTNSADSQDYRSGLCKRVGPEQSLHLLCGNSAVLGKSLKEASLFWGFFWLKQLLFPPFSGPRAHREDEIHRHRRLLELRHFGVRVHHWISSFLTHLAAGPLVHQSFFWLYFKVFRLIDEVFLCWAAVRMFSWYITARMLGLRAGFANELQDTRAWPTFVFLV